MVEQTTDSISKRAVYLVSLTHGIDHLIQLSLPIAVLVSTFTVLEQSLLLTIMLFMFGLGGLPAGWLADKMDSRYVILLYLILATVGMGIAALTTEFIFSLLGQIIIGIGIALYHPAGISLVSRLFPEGQRGRVMGIHGAVGNAIQASAPFLASLLFFQLGWQLGYFSLTIPTIIFVIIFLVWLRTQPILGNEPNNNEKPIEIIPDKPKQNPKWHQILFTQGIILALVISMIRGLYYQGTLAWLPTFFATTQTTEESLILSPILSAGVKTTLMLLPGMVAQVIGGALSDKHGWYLPLLGSGILAGLSLVALPFLPTIFLPIISAAIFGFAFFGAQSVENALLGDVTPEEYRGKAFGISFFLRFGIGSFAAGIGGLIILTSNIVWVFPVMGGLALATLPFIFRLKQVYKNSKSL